METQQSAVAQPPQQEAPPRILTAEERNDLRKKVLRGEKLSLEDARAVYATLRSGHEAAAIAGETSKKKGKKREALPDAQLDAELSSLGI